MKLKRLLITLLLSVLYFVQVQAQSRPAAKQPARPDTASPGVLCENAQGEQGIVYKKTTKAVTPVTKTTITKAASVPAKTASAPTAAKAAPPKATPPPILEEHH